MQSGQEIVQIVISNLKPDASRARFMELTNEMKKWLLSQDGFVSYEVYENDLHWADKIAYVDKESAERINQLFMRTEIAKEMLNYVEPDYTAFMGKSADVYRHGDA